MIENLNNFLKKYNYKAGIVPFSRLEELRREIEDWHNKKFIDDKLYNSYLRGFNFNEPEIPFKPESVIIVAVPQPQYRVYFNVRNKRLPVLIPSTYLNGYKINNEVK